jgi:hypothetical protein
MADAYEDSEGNGWIKYTALVKKFGIGYKRWRKKTGCERYYLSGIQYVPYEEYKEYAEIHRRSKNQVLKKFNFKMWSRLRKIAIEWQKKPLTQTRVLSEGVIIEMPHVCDANFQMWALKTIELAVSGNDEAVFALKQLIGDKLIHPLWVRYLRLSLLKKKI